MNTLRDAIKNGDLDTAMKLVENGYPVNTVYSSGAVHQETILHLACYKNDIEKIKKILKYNPNKFTSNSNYENVFQIAIKNRNIEILKLLTNNDLNARIIHKDVQQQYLCEKNDFNEYLNISNKYYHCKTLLTMCSNKEELQFLIDNGCKIDNTIISYCIYNLSYDLLDCLLENNVIIDDEMIRFSELKQIFYGGHLIYYKILKYTREKNIERINCLSMINKNIPNDIIRLIFGFI